MLVLFLLEISKATAFFLNRIKIGKTFHLLEKSVFEPNKQKWGSVELKWLNDCVVIGKRQVRAQDSNYPFIIILQ